MAALSTIFTVVSMAFSIIAAKIQKDKAKKAAKNAADDANRAANLQFTVEATVLPLPIPYGRCKVGGVRTLHVIPPTSLSWILFFQSYNRTAWGNTILDAFNGLISGAVDYTVPTTARNARTFSNTTLVHDNSKIKERDRYKYQNEVLIMQQAICVGGINQVLYAFVDEKPWELVKGVHINVYCDGGVVDPLIAQQGYVNNLFTGIAYATGAFLLERDEPQFGGVPQVQFLIEGLMVSYINRDDNYSPPYYSLSNKAYSNNPALCLLDYLMNSKYGLNVKESEIDLESFFNAMILCEYVVAADREKNGRFWVDNPQPRHIKRFECNVLLSSEASLRDNITSILNSMDMAELIWSGGKYKLQLKYPVSWNELGNFADQQTVQYLNEDSIDLYRSLISGNINHPPIVAGELNADYWARDVVAAYITDDDIIRGKELAFVYPNAQTRYNYVTVKYRNESKEFVEDTVGWPSKHDNLYFGMFADDNLVKLETEQFHESITDYWHALAKAEQICRTSRARINLNFTVSGEFNRLEPGDIIQVNSELLNMPGRLFMVNNSKVQRDNTLELETSSYDAGMLAWNAFDDEPTIELPLSADPPLQAINLVYSNNNLTWGKPNDSSVSTYEVKYTLTPVASITGNTYWITLGEVSRTTFNIPSTLDPGIYTFAVVSKTGSGRSAVQSGWPTVSGEVEEGAYLPPSPEPTYINIIIYTSAAVGVAPAAPVGGTYDFTQMQLSVVPSGWSKTIPTSPVVVWQSIGIVEYYPGDATYDMTGHWEPASEYIGVAADGVSTVLSPDVVTVLQNNAGDNINYDGAIGKYQVFLDGVEISDNASVAYSIEYNTNCIVTINDTPGASHGNFSVVSLTGNLGSAMLVATYDGIDYSKELTVVSFSEGYIPDYTPPPAPDPLDITVASTFTSIIVDIVVPTYTEGNGHAQTNVYCARVPLGDAYPVIAGAIELAPFRGSHVVYENFNDNWVNQGNDWLAYTYYFWFSNQTRDGINSDPTDDNGFETNFTKLGTNSLEENAVTLPIGAESFSSMAPLELPSTDFGDVSVLVTVAASGLLVNTAGETADMEIRLDTALVHTIPMLVGTQQIGSVPMASGSFTYIDYPGPGEHIYELTVVGLDSLLHQSISVVGLKR